MLYVTIIILKFLFHRFIRRGEVGSYKDELTPESQQKLNDFTQAFLSKHGIKEEDIFGNI